MPPNMPHIQVTSLLFQTIYERGQNASDPEILADVAAEAGLSKQDARTFLSSREAEDTVLLEDTRAKTQLRVRGVPCFRVAHTSEQGGSRNGRDVAAAGGRAGSSPIVLNGAVSSDQLVQAFESVHQG